MPLSLVTASIVFLVTLWRREYGIGAVIILLPAYLLRTTIIGIPTTALEVSIYALAGAWVIQSILSRRSIWPKLPRTLIIILGVWGFAWILATIFSTDRQASLGAFKAWLIDPLLFGVIVLTTIRTTQQRTVLFSSVILSGLVVAVAGVLQLVWFRDTLQDNRLSSFFHPVANYAAMFLGPILILTVGWLLWKQVHRLWWVAVGVLSVAVVLTVSFGGYLAVGSGLFIFWWRWPNRRTKGLAMLMAGMVLLLGLWAISSTPYLSEKFSTSDRSSSLVRTQIWRTSIEMIKDRPIFGVGPNAYEKVYRETIPKLYWPPLEWLVSQPHQLYLALWLETGLLGLLEFIVFVMWWLKSVCTHIRAGDGRVITATAAMVVTLVHGLVDTPYFKNDLSVLFVLVWLLPFLKVENKA